MSRSRGQHAVQRDEWCHEILTANQTAPQQQQILIEGQPQVRFDASPVAFYQANGTSRKTWRRQVRVVLGVELEVLQCHDHPFAKWTQTQFWQYAAFFSGLQPRQRRVGEMEKAPIRSGARS